MILQELNNLYLRLVDDPNAEIALRGWSAEKVVGEIVIAPDGHVVNVVPYVTGNSGNTKKYRVMKVPEHKGRSGSRPAPYFLCDNAFYLVGLGDAAASKDTPLEKRSRSKELHESILGDSADEAARAVLSFFEINQDEAIDDVTRATLQEMGLGNLMALKLEGDRCLIHERKSIVDAWTNYASPSDEKQAVAQCSVTGNWSVSARLFPQITGLPGAQSSGASLVSFNCDSFESYGYKQAHNASISEEIAFNAGTALKYLCYSEKHRCRIGDALVLFWSDSPAPREEALFAFAFANSPAEDEQTQQMIENAMGNLVRGTLPVSFDPAVQFCVMGLTPNAARLSVRFFERNTLGRYMERIQQYYQDVEIVDVRAASLYRLLLQAAPNGDGKKIPSTLITPCYRAMLTGCNYPSSLQSILLGRMRADHARNNIRDMGERAALLKACLIRRSHLKGKESDVTVALNRDNQAPGYLLGRLFAVMERAQQGAVGNTNATVRDKYIGGASTSPARVFQPLLRGCQAHLGSLRKNNPGLATKLEKELDEIVGNQLPAETFPKTLDQDQQALFFIGYYQERVALWRGSGAKSDGDKASSDDAEINE